LTKPSLLAEYVAALDMADRTAEDLILLEADAIADGDEADLERANAEWDASSTATGQATRSRIAYAPDYWSSPSCSMRRVRSGASPAPRRSTHELLEGAPRARALRAQDAEAGADVQDARRDQGASNGEDAVPMSGVREGGMGARRSMTEAHRKCRQNRGD
jgi:hypothetical protein